MSSPAKPDDVLLLSGPLTLDTAGGLYREFTSRWASGTAPTIVDLSATERVDSAGLALLLEWQALAQKRGHRLEFRSASTALIRLARLCGAADLLGLETPLKENTQP